MSSAVSTSSLYGLDAHEVIVEADIAPGLPAFSIVGLPDKAVQEARERVRGAFRQSELPFPRTRVTVNLAPADVRKNGTGFDLPIAISILMANGDLPGADDRERMCVGELALDGRIRSVHGVLSTALLASRCGVRELIVPVANAAEAALVPGLIVRAAQTLREVVDHCAKRSILSPIAQTELMQSTLEGVYPDFSAIRGQDQARRALEIAAAGGHNILLQGPPGSGKTLLARSFPGILPPLLYAEALEITRIHSVAGLLAHDGLLRERPFRAPHHSASGVALIGGGSTPKPGEISLAHRGVLFLDEFPEFSRHVLENLRQPLEDGRITVSRANGTVSFPARFMLVAAMNPCTCGFATDPSRPCICTPEQVVRYQKRLSGPLLDRIDVMIDVPKVRTEELTSRDAGEASDVIRERVRLARERQIARYATHQLFTNAELSSDFLRKNAVLSSEARSLLQTAIDRFALSARAYFRTLKVAQTIADLATRDQIETTDVAEALQYRHAVVS